jgi:hypothetical protein
LIHVYYDNYVFKVGIFKIPLKRNGNISGLYFAIQQSGNTAWKTGLHAHVAVELSVLAINVGYSTKESEKKKGRQYDLVAKRVYIFIYSS